MSRPSSHSQPAHNLEDNILCSQPAAQSSLEFDTDDFGRFEFPRGVGHGVDGVRSSYSNRDRSESSGVGRVRVRAEHQQSRCGVVCRGISFAQKKGMEGTYSRGRSDE